MEKVKEIRLNIRIGEDLKNKFIEICENEGLNSSAVVRRLLMEWIKEREPDFKIRGRQF